MKRLLFLLFATGLAAVSFGQVKVLGYIAPNGSSDTYPTHIDTLGQGGYMSFTTIASRNSLPALRRKENMLVAVKEDSSLYQLQGGLLNSNWKKVSFATDPPQLSPFFPGRYAYLGFDGTTEELVGASGNLGTPFDLMLVSYTGRPAGKSVRDVNIVKVGNTYWMAHTLAPTGTMGYTVGCPSIGISKSYDAQHWSFVKEVTISSTATDIVWSPKWYQENGRYYLLLSISPQAANYTGVHFTPYYCEVKFMGTDPVLSGLTQITGASIPTGGLNIDWTLNKIGSTYYMTYPNYSNGWVTQTKSTSPFSGYDGPLTYPTAPSQWCEGLQIKYLDGKYYMFYDKYVANTGMWYRTSTDFVTWSNETQLAANNYIIRNGNLIEKETREAKIEGQRFEGLNLVLQYENGDTKTASLDSTLVETKAAAFASIDSAKTTSPGFGDEYAYLTYDNATEKIAGFYGSLDSLRPMKVKMNGVSAAKGYKDASVIRVGSVYWMVNTYGTAGNLGGTAQTSFALSKSYDLQTWHFVKELAPETGSVHAWAPEWYVEKGRYYLLYSYCPNMGFSNFRLKTVEVTNVSDTATLGTPVEIAGTQVPNGTFITNPFLVKNGTDYYLFYDDLQAGHLRYIKSASPFSGYNTSSVLVMNNYPASAQIKYMKGAWYIIYDKYVGNHLNYITTTDFLTFTSPVNFAPTLRGGALVEKEDRSAKIEDLAFDSTSRKLTLSFGDGRTMQALIPGGNASGDPYVDFYSLPDSTGVVFMRYGGSRDTLVLGGGSTGGGITSETDPKRTIALAVTGNDTKTITLTMANGDVVAGSFTDNNTGSGTETDPVVKAVNGLVKSNGSTISAAVAGTDYVAPNAAITGATKTKITYDAKGLVLTGTNLAASDIPDLSGTYLLLSNVSTSTSLGTSNALVPSQGAVKAYVDAAVAALLHATDTAYLSTTLNKAYVDFYTLNDSTIVWVKAGGGKDTMVLNFGAGTGGGGSGTETDPVVKAVNGLVKSNGSTISAAVAGTDYVAPNAAITGATKTKVTYDAKGLVTAGADATTSDIAEGSRLYYTDARARAALSVTTTGVGKASYDNTTGIINVPGMEQNMSSTTASGNGDMGSGVTYNAYGNSTVGSVEINSGTITGSGILKVVHITFATAYANFPSGVQVTPGNGSMSYTNNSYRNFWVQNLTKTGFDIYATFNGSGDGSSTTYFFYYRVN